MEKRSLGHRLSRFDILDAEAASIDNFVFKYHSYFFAIRLIRAWILLPG